MPRTSTGQVASDLRVSRTEIAVQEAVSRSIRDNRDLTVEEIIEALTRATAKAARQLRRGQRTPATP